MGPPRDRFVQTLSGTVGQPVTLTVWAADQPPTTVFESTPPGGAAATPRGDFRVLWRKYRGPGDVKVANEVIALVNNGDAKLFAEATTTAVFSAPGEYWLRAQVNDSSGHGGGDQCCWTTAHVVVNIR